MNDALERESPIRVLIAKPGLDGHDVGAKLICRALLEAGMEVTYTGLRQSPEAIAGAVSNEDVDVLGLSIMSGAHIPLCSAVSAALETEGVRGVVWIVGGNIPARDHGALKELGVDGIFPVGTPFEEVVKFVSERGRA